jgi:hypothetical protein
MRSGNGVKQRANMMTISQFNEKNVMMTAAPTVISEIGVATLRTSE